jgi:hypothetical protein
MEVLPHFFTIGIHPDLSNEAYHASPGISKSGLWKIYTQSPAHFKYSPRKETKAFDFGQASHSAILEPETFEARVMRGPADRRGNKWADAVAEANNSKRRLLIEEDYDAVLELRDAVHADPFLNALIVSPHSQVEHSSFWIDPETGAQCRSRPDLYRADLGIMVDVKSTASAHPQAFARSVVNYGYHAQEAWYSAGHRANGLKVEGFVFLAFEKEAPYVTARYELPPSIVEDGRAICQKALARFAECEATGEWPGYSSEITELAFKRWAYQETDAPAVEAA